jgi:hypothetical protein
VEVVVGGAVLDGKGVCAGVSVYRNSVGEAVAEMGVSVTGALDGRLQADRAKKSIKMDNKLRNFIALLLRVLSIILCRNLADGNSS